MTLALNINNLSSRAIRLASTGGQGVRRIAANATTDGSDDDGAITSIYKAVEKFGQSLMSKALTTLGNGINFSWTKFWAGVTGGLLFLWNFDWNISDKQIDEKIKQAEIALAAAKGTLVGQSLGFTVCGFIPAATIAVFNEPLALYMMKELGEEAAEEIAGSLANLINLQFQQTVRQTFFGLFKNFRTLFRGAAIGFAQGMVQIGQFRQEDVDKAIKNRNQPFTFSGLKDEQIESISDPINEAYWESVWDEFQDSCIEAGFIVAAGADGFFAQQRMATQAALGTERLIEIQPIRNLDEAITP